jgi:tetratricopeptide (TPR) repeat protein
MTGSFRSRRVTAASVRFLVLVVGATALPVLTTATPAIAADPRDDAKALSKRAATAFAVAHFQEALDLYTQAYERFPVPALLFNLGQCNKNLGHFERALFFFQEYLRDKPDAANRPAVETLIAGAKKQLADARASETAEQAEHRKIEELEAEKLAAEAHEAEQIRGATAPTAEAAPPAPMHRRPVWMITGAATAGGGVILLGAGMYFGLKANSDASQLTQLSTSGGAWSTRYQSTYTEGQSAAHTATGLYVAGAILVAGGATLAVLGLQKHSDSGSVTAGIAPMPGGSSVFVAGRF